MFKLVITVSAAEDLRRAYSWWRDNRSGEQAAQWYVAASIAIQRPRIDVSSRWRRICSRGESGN